MGFGIAEDFKGREQRVRQGVCPPLVFFAVVRLCFAECIAFVAEPATHTERQNGTADVALRYVVAFFFDVGLLVAVSGAILLASAGTSLFGEVAVSAHT